jgi:hypothetical protein
MRGFTCLDWRVLIYVLGFVCLQTGVATLSTPQNPKNKKQQHSPLFLPVNSKRFDVHGFTCLDSCVLIQVLGFVCLQIAVATLSTPKNNKNKKQQHFPLVLPVNSKRFDVHILTRLDLCVLIHVVGFVCLQIAVATLSTPKNNKNRNQHQTTPTYS